MADAKSIAADVLQFQGRGVKEKEREKAKESLKEVLELESLRRESPDAEEHVDPNTNPKGDEESEGSVTERHRNVLYF